ncbi:xanthine dehydrogenase family protein molybdopterin-binding subunit [Quisquiliibacterium transsilvanicum]|uniref:CO/xanthine dehydrogenase Mo-binding subunit n=1 Tax=Quisquiliibacterium transsilvanicum TaxID=1549638 RepID=A0A7W8HKM0_9BURK|nr:xanthine dehydrogenase family protein molybdopterin-binding subunit [Quisquiliibacterium transsilvanicum]MBB5272918.1 CO/xanthine dehydrogenase Mo-binding subunit [Quisquiliibacterium transsilvanicum]
MNDRANIPAAAQAAALHVVGTRPVRPDGADKVTGRANFGADLRLPGMLTGRVKRSPHAHARILGIDIAAAAALPGVKAVVTAADFPALAAVAVEGGEGAATLRDVSSNCMARDKVLYVGHAVAAVAATSAAIAEAALALIEVRYEALPHVIEVEAAMAPGAPLLHEDLRTKGVTPAPEAASNVAEKIMLGRGDVAAAFVDPAQAEVVVEGRYVTAAVHQGYIEPHACVASAGADGQHQVWVSTQGQFMVRTLCAKLLGIAPSDIRVTPAEIGGGFGGKTTVYLEPVALALSRKCGRPVRMVMTRAEVFEASGPTSGAVAEVKLAARRDGRIVAAELVLKFQAGAFPGSPVGPACMTAFACYDIEHVAVTGYDVVSNRPKVAAYRAPGAPISAFAVESAMDELALKLGMDPIDLRLANAVKPGIKAVYGATFREIAFIDTLRAIQSHPHYRAPLPAGQGRGVACGFWFNAGGESSAAVHVDDDGGATVVSSSPDIGGSRASLAMMAAETLGLPIERVRAVVADTTAIGFSGLTGGSRVTFATGMAVVQAAQKVVDDLKRRAAATWDCSLEHVEWRDGQARCADPEKPQPPLGLKALAARSARTGGPIGAEASINAQGAGPGFAVHLCDVALDPETGRSTVVRYTAAQDVGRAIHPSYVEGQIQGGVAQGIGWALNEEYVYDAQGVQQNPGFLDYRMPVTSDLPMIDTILVETAPNSRHPYGAKGVGEAPIVPPLAAVANALSHAVGRRLAELPLSPPRVLDALDAARG